MKEFIRKIGGLVEPISEAKGGLLFFALVLREDASVWDVLVAAKWIDKDRKGSLRYLTQQIQAVLTKEELLKISSVILLRSEYYVNQDIMTSETGWVENNIDMYGLAVKRAYIFVSTDGYFNPIGEEGTKRILTDPDEVLK